MSSDDSLTLVVIAVYAFAAFSVCVWIAAIISAITNPRLDSAMKAVWFLVIFLFFLVGVLLYLLVAPSRTVSHEPSTGLKTCPACAESVKAAANVCRFCRHTFVTGSQPVDERIAAVVNSKLLPDEMRPFPSAMMSECTAEELARISRGESAWVVTRPRRSAANGGKVGAP